MRLLLVLFLILTTQPKILLAKKTQYEVFKVSKGVVLVSTKYGKITNPVRNTYVNKDDKFELADERYFVKLRDSTGQIYTYTGKGYVSALQIVNGDKYTNFERFLQFLFSLAQDSGFNTTPICTSQCVTEKGRLNSLGTDSLSFIVAANVKQAISDTCYFSNVLLTKKNLPDNETFNYVIQNKDTTNYVFTIYTVDKNGSVNNPNRIIVKESTEFRFDEISFIPLLNQNSIDLTYFTMAELGVENNTCYVLLFNLNKIWKKQQNGKYPSLDWNLITREFTYQGDVNRVILIQ